MICIQSQNGRDIILGRTRSLLRQHWWTTSSWTNIKPLVFGHKQETGNVCVGWDLFTSERWNKWLSFPEEHLSACIMGYSLRPQRSPWQWGSKINTWMYSYLVFVYMCVQVYMATHSVLPLKTFQGNCLVSVGVYSHVGGCHQVINQGHILQNKKTNRLIFTTLPFPSNYLEKVMDS